MPPDISLVPRPRHYARELRLGALEWVGIPLLSLLPLLALAGLLGPSSALKSARIATANSALSVQLVYPSRLRRVTDGELLVTVSNAGPGELRELVLSLDEAYLLRFGRVQSLPAADSVDSGARRIALPVLRAGESTSVRLSLEADDWGRLPGWIELGVGRAPVRARLSFDTLVLP